MAMQRKSEPEKEQNKETKKGDKGKRDQKHKNKEIGKLSTQQPT
jgi:hypothetical protein